MKESKIMKISEILSSKGSDVHVIGHTQSFNTALRMMYEAQIGSVIVVHSETGQLLGLISQPEILAGLASMGASALSQGVTGIMRKPVPICHLQDDASLAARYITAERSRHVVVVDDHGKLAGLISIGDIVAAQLVETRIEAEVLRDMARSCMLTVA